MARLQLIATTSSMKLRDRFISIIGKSWYCWRFLSQVASSSVWSIHLKLHYLCVFRSLAAAVPKFISTAFTFVSNPSCAEARCCHSDAHSSHTDHHCPSTDCLDSFSLCVRESDCGGGAGGYARDNEGRGFNWQWWLRWGFDKTFECSDLGFERRECVLRGGVPYI